VGKVTTVESGDAVSFDAYVRAHSIKFLRLTTLLVGNAATAEDVLQTSLEKVWRHWPKIDGRASTDSYVYKTVVNTWRSWRRTRWRQEEAALTPLDLRSSEDLAQTASDRDLLRVALNRLPPKQKAAIVLRFYADLTIADTAAVLGCAEGTVKSQTADALKRLRGELQKAEAR
jgi:RNA polymerase sigma-70 factor (sigma-E family)